MPGTSSSGRSASTRQSQRIHSQVYWPGRLTSEVASGSRTPESAPSSPPSIFATAVAGQRAADRHQVEGHPRREADRDRAEPRDRATPRERSGQPEEGQQEDGLRPREGRQPECDRGRDLALPGPEHERGGHEEGGERDLHARERAPHHRPRERGERPAARSPSSRRPVQSSARDAGEPGGRAGPDPVPEPWPGPDADPNTVKAPPSASVHSGAVDPDTGTPGL